MDSLFILIPIAIIFAAVAIRAFIWAVNNRQYDDLDKAANSILFDDDVEVRVADDIRDAARQRPPDEAAKRDGND